MSDRVKSTGTGSRTGSFQPLDWLLVTSIPLIWGSSFLWIAIGLDSFAPGVVAWLRVVFGAGVLLVLPGTRHRIDRQDWPSIAVVAVAGNAGPALLFAWAEQDLESAVAGMITSFTPIMTLLVALALGNRAVGARHVVGLMIAFVGVLLMAAPDVVGANAPVLGVTLVLLASFGYAVTNNVIAPLQQRYGGLVVVAKAQALSAVLLLPFGVVGLQSSRFSVGALVAVLILGVVGTGVARVLSATLIGRAGPQRGSVVAYLVPVVAIILGVAVRDESIELIQLLGLVLVLGGAALVSRR